MNKDVIYIEPEDDITDILAKLKQSTQKIVALVPPKKIGVLRSAVNIKLIARTAQTAEKTAVLVTVDPSLIKLAANARIPVAKNLQSRPEIPTAEAIAERLNAEQVIDEDLSTSDEATDKPQKPSTKANSSAPKTNSDNNQDSTEQPKASQKSANRKNNKIPSIDKHRKRIIIAAAAFIVILGFLLWALLIAPAVKITASVQTNATNFSENLSFTMQDADEDLKAGKFLIEEQKTEKPSQKQFKATGKQDKGHKATGSLVIYAVFSATSGGSINIPAGASFTYNSLRYVVSSGVTLSYSGGSVKNLSRCDNSNEVQNDLNVGCQVSTNVNVTAAEPGEKYNVGANASGWGSNVGGVGISRNHAISGGTTDIKTVVQQSDVDQAIKQLKTEDEAALKAEFTQSLSDKYLLIEPSFDISTSDAVSNPAVGAEAPDGNATLTVTTTVKVFTVDKGHITDFIKQRSKIADDERVYSVGEPYFDRFIKTGDTYSAKLKTTTQVGPKITEDEILEQSKGRKIGEVKAQLQSFNGVTEVNIEPSFFWVRSIPNDANRISITLQVDEDKSKQKTPNSQEE